MGCCDEPRGFHLRCRIQSSEDHPQGEGVDVTVTSDKAILLVIHDQNDDIDRMRLLTVDGCTGTTMKWSYIFAAWGGMAKVLGEAPPSALPEPYRRVASLVAQQAEEAIRRDDNGAAWKGRSDAGPGG